MDKSEGSAASLCNVCRNDAKSAAYKTFALVCRVPAGARRGLSPRRHHASAAIFCPYAERPRFFAVCSALGDRPPQKGFLGLVNKKSGRGFVQRRCCPNPLHYI